MIALTRSLAEPWADTTSPAGTLILTVFAGVAQFERARARERQMAGIARAKAEGKYCGREATHDREEIVRVYNETGSVAAAVKRLGCSRATVYRALEQVADTRANSQGDA